MDKIIAVLAIVGIALGALLIPRTARGATVNENATPDDPDFQSPSGARGIINNNPFNIKFVASIPWRGQIGTDGTFAVFDTPLNGIRAGMVNIHTQVNRNGFSTIRKLIGRLSPEFENPTENFVAFVSNRLGISPEQQINWQREIIPLSKAIIQFENTQRNIPWVDPYSDELYSRAKQETGKT